MHLAILMAPVLYAAMYAIGLKAEPVASAEPKEFNATELAVSTGLPFEMITATPSAPLLQARGWEAPSASAWSPAASAWTSAAPVWTPAPTGTRTPNPTPSYTWAETHNDDKNAFAHGIIAAIVIGLFLGVGFVGCVIFSIYRRCCGSRLKVHGRKNKARDIETGSLTTPNIEMRKSDSITIAENKRPTKPREYLGAVSENDRQITSPPR